MRRHPLYRILIWIAFLGCIVVLYDLVTSEGFPVNPTVDTANYWASARILLNRENPYLAEKVLSHQEQAGRIQDLSSTAISMFLNPPWTLPFTLPLGLLAYPMSRVVWLLFHTLIIMFCSKLIWNLYGGSSSWKIIPYLITVFFAPTLFLLGTGHITPLLLLGIVGFQYFIENTKESRWHLFFAGISASLVTLKPQILYLFLVAITIWIVRNQSWIILSGFITSVLVLTSISLIFDPLVLSHYWQLISTDYSIGIWATPTIGLILRAIFGYEKVWLQILPILLGIIWFIFRWRQQYRDWDWLEEMPVLLLVCVMTFPYGWTYDMVVLLIPVLAIFAHVSRIQLNWQAVSIIMIFFLMNLVNLSLHMRFSDFWFVWFAPALLVWFLIACRVLNYGPPSRFIQDKANTP